MTGDVEVFGSAGGPGALSPHPRERKEPNGLHVEPSHFLFHQRPYTSYTSACGRLGCASFILCRRARPNSRRRRVGRHEPEVGGEDAVCSANELFDTWKIRPPSLRSFSQMPCSIQWRRRMPVVRAKFDPSSLPLGVYIGHNHKERDTSPADLPHQRWSMVGKRLIFLRSTGALFSGSVHRFFCV